MDGGSSARIARHTQANRVAVAESDVSCHTRRSENILIITRNMVRPIYLPFDQRRVVGQCPPYPDTQPSTCSGGTEHSSRPRPLLACAGRRTACYQTRHAVPQQQTKTHQLMSFFDYRPNHVLPTPASAKRSRRGYNRLAAAAACALACCASLTLLLNTSKASMLNPKRGPTTAMRGPRPLHSALCPSRATVLV